MRKLLSANSFRIFHSKWFWLCLGGMLAMSVGFIIMQYTAMDYTVPLSRVIFLPMSFYGVTVAALHYHLSGHHSFYHSMRHIPV